MLLSCRAVSRVIKGLKEKLIAKRGKEWDPSEVPTLYFNRVKTEIKQLTRAGIMLDLKERTDMALYYLKSSGEFDAVRE
jgi:hypothetical protein